MMLSKSSPTLRAYPTSEANVAFLLRRVSDAEGEWGQGTLQGWW